MESAETSAAQAKVISGFNNVLRMIQTDAK